MSDTKFLLDTSPLVDARKEYYAFDFCPGFWEELLHAHKRNLVFSIDRVKSEIKDYKDELNEWVSNQVPNEFFLNSRTAAVASRYQSMM